jgi:glycosyltransferase involved in cell wall biosynthesis
MENDRRRRVLILIPTLLGGGAERVIVTLLQHLDRSRFRFTLAVVDTRGAVFREDVPEDVEFVDLGCSRVRYAMPSILRLIWRLRPHVVLSTLGHLNLALALLRPLLPWGVRLVARETIVVSRNLQWQGRAWVWALAYRLMGRAFDVLICQSQDMKDDLVANFGASPEKMVVINNPVDVARVRRLAAVPVPATGRGAGNAADLRLVAAGRLVEQKGFDLLLEAVARCADRRLQLTILGEGPLRPMLEAQARALGIADRVHFAGFQANPYPFFRHADAFVLSSRFEGFPNVVLEALACGTPVIATPAPGGVREILDGIRGCVVAEDISATALAGAIRSYEGKAALPDTLMERYSVDRIAACYEEVLA